ncbi:MAG TPA: phytanoyl-CoA dioxygenase family protein [Rhizomicrobium sp.]|jgi:ectoine hydroxylase-related dioxygenase (phytanoyl-CoA dioxygenase family)
MDEQQSDLIHRYRRDGFVKASGLLSRDEIDAYRVAVDEAVARRTAKDTRAFAEKTPYGQSFLQCLFLWEDSPAVRPLTFHPNIAGLAARLLDTACVRLWHDQALYKEAGGRETEAHQDFAYWPVNEPDMLTAWIPLVDVDEENGCMGYVAGTQEAPREFVDIFRSAGAGTAYAARHAQAQYIPAKRGDVIFHGARTVHMAMPNRSVKTRAVHTVVYFRDGCTRTATGASTAQDRNGTKPGDRIAGPATPIAWPLPDGKLPQPPPPFRFAEAHRDLIRAGTVPAPDRDQAEW